MINGQTPNLANLALGLVGNGLSVVPVRPDKKPTTSSWKQWQTEIMTHAEVREHFTKGIQIALIAGAVSGNLECLDFDKEDLYQPFLDTLESIRPDLRQRLTLRQKTPSGGFHLIYRCNQPVTGNAKLARSAKYTDGKGHHRQDVYIETRGEGGYFLVAPSCATPHGGGQPVQYQMTGSFDVVPVITAEEKVFLHTLARSFDEGTEASHPEKATDTTGNDGERPGDRFNRETDWHTLLSGYGWTPGGTVGDRQHWTRPGKTDGSISATLHPDRGLYVFSTSTPLPTEKPLSKFSVFAYYDHGGDFQAAARELARRYGMERPAASEAESVSTAEKAPDQIVAKNGKKRTFSLIQVSKIVTMPADWLIQDFLTTDSLCMFFSDPGGCKTFLAVSAACSTATGQPFYGRKAKQRPVVFIAGEGLPGLKKRFDAWSVRHQVSLENAPLFISTAPAAFLEAASVADVMEAVDSVVREHGLPGLIVIDTLARNFGPGDENATADMGVFIQAADQIREKYRSAVLLIHHTGHADKSRARGAIALKGALDFEYRLDRGGDDVIRLDCTKCKDFEPPAPMAFRLRSVELPSVVDENDQPITSAVLDATDYEPAARTTNSGRGKNQQKALEILKALFDHHRANIKEDGRDPASARVSVDEWQSECKRKADIPRNRFREASRSLEEAGAVATENGFVSLLVELC